MFHRCKGENKINKINNLYSLSDLFLTLKIIINKNDNRYSLLNIIEHDYITIEDQMNNNKYSNIDIWAVIRKDIIYIRTMGDKTVLINRDNKIINTTQSIIKYEEILRKEFKTYSSFLEMLKTKGHKNSYNLCVDTGRKCKKESRIMKIINAIINLKNLKG